MVGVPHGSAYLASNVIGGINYFFVFENTRKVPKKKKKKKGELEFEKV
jgi:hypothetical protein